MKNIIIPPSVFAGAILARAATFLPGATPRGGAAAGFFRAEPGFLKDFAPFSISHGKIVRVAQPLLKGGLQ